MKKLYFLLITMLVSLSASAGAYYVNGATVGWPGWTETILANYKMTETSSGVWEIDMTKTPKPDLSGDLLMVYINGNSAEWTTGTRTKGTKIKEGVATPYNASNNGNNLAIDGTIKNAYIKLDTNAKTVTVTGKSEANSFEQVYLIGDFGDGWSESVTTYPMTAVAGKANVYAGTFDLPACWCKPKAGTVVLAPKDAAADIVPNDNYPYTVEPGGDKSFQLEAGTYEITITVKQEAETGVIQFKNTNPVTPTITVYWDNTDTAWDEVYADITGGADGDDQLSMTAGLDEVWSVSLPADYTGIVFSNGAGAESPKYTPKDSYIYSMTNAGSPFTPRVDRSGWYVNVLGTFNGWADNGIVPDADGMVTHNNLKIGTQDFKVKIWTGEAEVWLSTGSALPLDTWVTIPGNNDANMTVSGATADDVYNVEFNCNTNAIRVSKSAPIDYTTYYVNVVGDFNEWTYNGVNPNAEGIAECEAANVNTAFKIKVWNGTSDEWYAKGQTVLTAGTWIDIKGNSDPSTMTMAEDLQNCNLTFTFNCKTGEVKVEKGAGVEGVGIDNTDAAPVYYNLQGVRVAEPQNGLYIVVRGNKVAKEIVR